MTARLCLLIAIATQSPEGFPEDICFNYNYKSCSGSCKKSHICRLCRGPHKASSSQCLRNEIWLKIPYSRIYITVLDSDRPSKYTPIMQASSLDVGSAHASSVGISVVGMLSEQVVVIPDLLDSDKDYVRSFVEECKGPISHAASIDRGEYMGRDLCLGSQSQLILCIQVGTRIVIACHLVSCVIRLWI